MNTSVVYTSIFGQYDRLIDPIVSSNDIDYICFTDSPGLTSDIWQIRIFEPCFPGDMVRSARLHKICPHRFLSEYEYSLYIDGNMRLRQVPDVVALLNGGTLAMERHRKRKCLYAEAEVCKERGLDDPTVIDRQTNAYRKEGFPRNAGFYASYMIARRHNDGELRILSEKWWAHVCLYSRRDQISLPVCLSGTIEHIPADTRRRLVTIMGHHGKG